MEYVVLHGLLRRVTIELACMQSQADGPPSPERAEQLLGMVCSSGRPFILVDVCVVVEEGEEEGEGAHDHRVRSVAAGTGEVGELWVRGPTVFPGKAGCRLLCARLLRLQCMHARAVHTRMHTRQS